MLGAALILDKPCSGGLTHEAIPAVHRDGGDCRTGIDRVGSGQGSGRYQGSARYDVGVEGRRYDDARPKGRHIDRFDHIDRVGQVDWGGSGLDEEAGHHDGVELTWWR